jgi:uncharacterized protein
MLFQRKIIPHIYKWVKEKEIIMLNGPRQVGKTSILKLLKNKLVADKAASENEIFYLNLEEINVLSPLNENPENLLAYIKNDKKKNYFFLDEIQYLDNPSNFLKHIYDKYADKIKIICTGSSNLELKAKLQDSLAGRKITFMIAPLCFEEFLIFKQADIFPYFKKKTKPAEIKSQFDNYLYEYLIYGGMPAVALKNDAELKKDLLREYVDTYINKDVRSIGKIDDILKFNQLIKVLASQIGNLLNISEISNTLNMSRRTVEEYLNLLELTFVLHKISPFAKNIRSQITKMPKIYFFDIGIRNQILGNLQPMDQRTDSGQIFENFIYLELKSSLEAQNISFYRTTSKSEIDFIISSSTGILPVEAKFSQYSKPAATRTILSFCEEMVCEKSFIVNLNLNLIREKVHFIDYLSFIENIKI